MNVALLTIDALRADHVGWLGYERDTTPRLNEIATESAVYETAIAQSSHTRESMPSLFYSAYPRELGAVGPVPDDRPTLATELSDAGFSTAGFHSNPYLSRAYEFDRGFDAFDDSLPLARNRVATFLHRVVNHFRLQPYERASDLTDQGLEWFDEADGQRFLWLHYMDPHGPYQPPADYQELFRDTTVDKREAKRLWRRTVDEPETVDRADRDQLVDLYDAEIRYLDEHVDRFFDGLAERDLLSDTLVIVAADHGDAFGEHGIYGHPRRLYESLIHVPLLVRPPGGADGSRIENPVENVDIAPTILDAAGRSPPSSFAGSLLPKADIEDSDPAFAHAHGEGDETGRNWYAVRTAQHKLHLQIDEDGVTRRRELYDLTSADGESIPVESDRDDIREQLEELLSTHLESIDQTEKHADEAVDDVVQDRLEMLGYRE